MKALSIEELKVLPVGDYVWVVGIEHDFSEYGQIKCNSQEKWVSGTSEYLYFNYGKTWVAYKNKEQAECKGELVELPYKIEKLHIGDTIYYIQEYFNDATLKHEKKVLRTNIDYIAKGYIEVNNGVWLQPNQFWLIKEQAEQKLKELINING